jgi:hypothetical protein
VLKKSFFNTIDPQATFFEGKIEARLPLSGGAFALRVAFQSLGSACGGGIY